MPEIIIFRIFLEQTLSHSLDTSLKIMFNNITIDVKVISGIAVNESVVSISIVDFIYTDNVENRVETIEIPNLKVDNSSAELSYNGVKFFSIWSNLTADI